MWEEKNPQNAKNLPNSATENRSVVVTYGEVGDKESGRWVKAVKGYKFPVIRRISSGDVMYSM